MATKKTVEQAIIAECLDVNGLTSILRENNFDENKYTQLHDLIVQYRHLIDTEVAISRKVVGCLRILEHLLGAAVAYHDRQPSLSETGKKTKRAHSEVWELLNAILDVNL